MGAAAFLTAKPLDREKEMNREGLYGTKVMAIANQGANLATGTLNHVKLKVVYCMIIKILRKIIARRKDNCYHSHVIARRSNAPSAWWRETG